MTSKQLVLGALFAAMTIALKPIDIYFLPTARLNVTAVPIILSGITLGPVIGAIVGFIADVLGYVLFDKSGQPIALLLTISSVMMGLIPGIIYRLTPKTTKKTNLFSILNILSFFLLVILLIVLLAVEGSVQIENGYVLALHPLTSEWIALEFWVVAAITGAFALYAFVLVFMLARKIKSPLVDQGKLLFTVSITVILAEILVSSLGLMHVYAWPLLLILIIRIIKGFLVIPLYTLLSAVLYKVIIKMKLIV